MKKPSRIRKQHFYKKIIIKFFNQILFKTVVDQFRNALFVWTKDELTTADHRTTNEERSIELKEIMIVYRGRQGVLRDTEQFTENMLRMD